MSLESEWGRPIKTSGMSPYVANGTLVLKVTVNPKFVEFLFQELSGKSE